MADYARKTSFVYAQFAYNLIVFLSEGNVGEFLIDLKERGSTGALQLNFLWREQNVYIMDNHRAAAWCWCQHIKDIKKFSLVHIDAHFDCVPLPVEFDFRNLSLDAYLGEMNGDEAMPMERMRWDNFIPPFVKLHNRKIDTCFFATHGEGCEPTFKRKCEYISADDLGTFSFFEDTYPYIVDIDLDYFYFSTIKGKHHRLFSKQFTQNLWRAIRTGLRKNKILALTVALTPRFCGGWPNAEELCREICDTLDLDFKLPLTS